MKKSINLTLGALPGFRRPVLNIRRDGNTQQFSISKKLYDELVKCGVLREG